MCILLESSASSHYLGTEKTNVTLTITPTDGYNLKERKKHDGHYGCVMVHQLENIDPHLERNALFNSKWDWGFSSLVIIWLQPIQWIAVCTCMTQGIPRRQAVPQTARTNSSLRLKNFIIRWSNSSMRLVTITSTIANFQNRNNSWIITVLGLVKIIPYFM